MVEGGARVIRSFLSAAQRSGNHTQKDKAVDALVVTVAPTLVGSAGVGYGTELHADAVSVIVCHRAVVKGVGSVDVWLI